jgi:phosphoglycerol transferase MdoB-like AlkP superfamily enzyme
MKQLSFAVFRQLAFWMLYFFLFRLLFLFYYSGMMRMEDIQFNEILKVFYSALKLDLSTAAYLTLVSFIVLLFFYSTGKALFQVINKWVVSLMIGVYSLTCSSETGLYAEWKTKLSAKALAYLSNPVEIFQTVSLSELFILLSIWGVTTFIGIWIYNKFFAHKNSSKTASLSSLWAVGWLLPILFFFVRGGLSAIPVSVSSAYFSKHSILNAVAVNPLYNIGFSLLNAAKLENENIFGTIPEQEAIEIVKQLHDVKHDTTISIIKNNRPNIVVLLLESWSADLIESLGGEPGITPHFKELEKEGLLFTQFYANANRSQQAMSSLYAGLPGIPVTTISDHPDKYAALPSLSKDLQSAGYQTAFYFGGQLNYGNILSYLMANEIDFIMEGKDFPDSMPRGRLGVHDGIVLPYVAGKLISLKEPFFATIFTLSSHSPYDFPMEHLIQWPKMEKEFVNGGFYTDKSIAAFFEKAKSEKWFENTLFILMADHSKNSYRNHPLESFEYHKIPLLLCGPALNDTLRGRTYDKICGNTDIPATLLKQLKLPAEAYFWSKNVFNPNYIPFAYFELNEGLGWKRPEGYFVWDKFADRYYQKNLPLENEQQIIREGKAYLQVLYGDFLKY